MEILFKVQLTGDFRCGDPNAYIDKDVFFYAKNDTCNPFGKGVDIKNVSIYINGEHLFNVDVWPFGEELVIGKNDGVKFDVGNTVAIHVNGQYINKWTCPFINHTMLNIASKVYKMKPKGIPVGRVLKVLLKKRK